MRPDESWMEEAACRGRSPELFYANEEVLARAGLQVCASCPVRRHCLEYALTYGIEDGVWGGHTERERRRMLRAMRRSA